MNRQILAPELNETEERIMDGQLHLRIPKPLLKDFKAKCDLIGRTHQNVVREMMEALIDGRLTIKPNQHQKDLYNDD